MNERNGKRVFVGYDGSTYHVGDRVELHPACDCWMRGARYGTVTGKTKFSDYVRVRLDVIPKRIFRAHQDNFRAVK